MRRKVISLLLILSVFCSMLMAEVPAHAAESSSNSGMVISKRATANEDGTYTITLEAYATGSKIITETQKEVPTDIILVLDQSGSMDEDIQTVSFEAYEDGRYDSNTKNSDHYENRHNGGDENLYYSLEDGSYASVSVTVQSSPIYTPITNGLNNSSGGWGGTATNYWNNRNNLFAKVNDEYQKVTVTRVETGKEWYGSTYEYIYTLPEGTEIARSSGNSETPSFSNIDGNVLYLLGEDESKAVYTYTYTDKNGDTQTIGTSIGADTTFETTLYERVVRDSGTTKLSALKSAATTFVNNVSSKALGADGEAGTTDDVAHRIAVVGFASTGNSYTNTELLSTQNVVNYGNATDTNYRDALVSVNGANGTLNSRLSTAIQRLDGSGDTYLQYGMDMANKIFEQYPIAADDTTGRQRVVIVFTDGYPAPAGTDNFNYTMADAAISNSNTTKNTYKATVYTVGVLDDADPTASITDGYSYGGTSAAQQTVASNRYMHYVSTNYPSAVSMQNGGSLSPDADPFAGGDSYYLSASDSATLNNIFQQISDKIESGGSSTSLSEETVIKDIIAPEFTLPTGATANDITLETYSCTGKSGDEYTWSKNAGTMGASAVVNGDNVSVTGFDFADNYVGTVTENGSVTYRGNKLVIKFTVSPKSGFLGGNNVYTNTSAGIYENSSADSPVLEFERPQVNVPIDEVTVTCEDKNVYLLGELTAEELRSGATVKVGDTELSLDPTNTNYGLEAWQTEYVNITVEIKDKDGNVVPTDLSDLADDQIYTISVEVAPKTDGTGASGTPADEQSGNGKGNIYVYKPELTFKDTTVYYGSTAPSDFSGNLTDTKWKHGSNEADVEEMGTAPTLELTYTPDAAKIADGKINTKQDIAVDVTVKIGETDIMDKTDFVHTACTDDCSWNETTLDGTPAFLLHVQTCQLTINKTGGAADEPYVFFIYKDGEKYSEATIVGNGSETIYELPIGKYTIEEDTGWSWRYNAEDDGYASLTAANPTGSITCTNAANEKIYWLNGFSNVVKNIFGISN